MSKTIKDVAARAGVSTATVSNVINHTRYVSDELRSRVENAIKEVGYFPNQVAGSLRRGDSKCIGLILPDNSNPFFAEIAKYIENEAFENGYSVFLCNSASNIKREETHVKMLISKQIDGIIIIPSHSDYSHLLPLETRGTPVVLVDREVPLKNGDLILVNNKSGGYLATKYLIELGHTKIACISGPSDVSPSGARLIGYYDALKEAGIPIRKEFIFAGDFQFQSGERMMAKILDLKDRPTAIFICNDMMAIGAIKQAQASNIHIPEDLSVVGFDDIQFVSTISPALTTIAQPIRELALTAISLLLKKIQNGHESHIGEKIVLEPSLVARDSCRHLNDGDKIILHE